MLEMQVLTYQIKDYIMSLNNQKNPHYFTAVIPIFFLFKVGEQLA